MDEVLKAVNDAFIAKAQWFTDAGLSPPKTIDFYFGQPENPDDFEFVLPSLFMDYSVAWVKNGNYYEGPASLTFHPLPDLFPGTENINPRQEEGFKVNTWYRLVRQTLDTVTGENFADLVRGPETPAVTNDFNYHTLTYDTMVVEIPGTEVGKYTNGSIEEVNVTGKIKKVYDFKL